MMKEFSDYINSRNTEQLKAELQELYASFEVVKNYYRIRLGDVEIDEKILSRYKDQIINALYPNKYMQGGLDVEKVNTIVQQVNSSSTVRYYIEVGLMAVEECTKIANEFGGDFGEDFYIYFEELFEDTVKVIVREKLGDEYKIRLREIVHSACEDYGHYDQLQDTLNEYIEE